jgi:hypothetical protein
MNVKTTRRIATAGGILLTLVVAILVVYRFAPGAALAGIYRLYELRAGVTREEAQLDGYTVPYRVRRLCCCTALAIAKSALCRRPATLRTATT